MFNNAMNFLNGRTKRKLKANTYAELLSPGCVAIRYHNTDILKIYSSGLFELNTDGWNTISTRSRLNELMGKFGSSGKVYVTKGFLHYVQPQGGKIEFFDGMLIDQVTGRCVNYWNR